MGNVKNKGPKGIMTIKKSNDAHLRDKTHKVDSEILIGYDEILKDIRIILTNGLGRVRRAVDFSRIKMYWEIGERMARGELENKDRADYGQRLVATIAEDIGFSRYELSRIIDFYRAYPIVADIPQQLSWSHIRELLPLAVEKRKFYELKAQDERWNHLDLRKAIQEQLYEAFKKSRRSLPVKRLPTLPSSEEIFKDDYDFAFLELARDSSERELEDALLDRVIKVLTELGRNFSLVGRQVKILIDGNWEKIDLIFYHTRIHCFILAELKKGRFRKGYIGQMNTYIEYYRHNEQSEGDNPTIGLILCEDIGYEEAIYALGGLEEKIFIAKYRLELPSERQIKEGMKRLDQE